MKIELDRVVFNGSFLTMRSLTYRMDRLREAFPWLEISVELKWRRADHKVSIFGAPRFVLPIRGVVS